MKTAVTRGKLRNDVVVISHNPRMNQVKFIDELVTHKTGGQTKVATDRIDFAEDLFELT